MQAYPGRMSEPVADSDESAPVDDTSEDDFDEMFDDEDDPFEDDAALAADQERLAVQRASAISPGAAGGPPCRDGGCDVRHRRDHRGAAQRGRIGDGRCSSDPHDLEKEGFGATVDGVDVEAPPLERLDPVTNRKSRR